METKSSEARAYLRTAQGGLVRPEKFNAVAVFQLTALSLESFLLGWLEQRGEFPDHHGFRDLVRAVERHRLLPTELRTGLLSLDQYQRLCDWIPIEPRQPQWEELPALVALAVQIEAFTER